MRISDWSSDVCSSDLGFSEALTRMKKGGEYKISIPPQLGYGDRAAGPIPANSTLHFTVTLLDFRSEAEVRAMQQQMQQMQQQQMMPGGDRKSTRLNSSH